MEFENIALTGHNLCIGYQLLHSQDMRSVRKSIHEPLGLKFNRRQTKKVLMQKLNVMFQTKEILIRSITVKIKVVLIKKI